MKIAIVASLVALISFCTAQGVPLNGLPDCAKSCLDLGDLTKLGCSSSLDVTCICKNHSFVDGLSCCVSKSCQPDDIKKTIDFANGICKAASVTLPTAATCTGSAASTATGGISTSGSAISTAVSSGSSQSTASATSATTGGTESSATSAVAVAATSSTGGALVNACSPVGGAAGLVAALAALL